MILKDGWEITIASPADYEELVAEIYYNGLFFAQVCQERGKGLFDLETPGPGLVESLVVHRADAIGFVEAVEAACRHLKGPSDEFPTLRS